MNRFFLCFLTAIFSIFVHSTIWADKVYKQEVVKVNNISMYKDVAVKIIESTKNDCVDSADRNIDRDKEVYIRGCKLVEMVSDLYLEAISDGDENKNIVWRLRELDGKQVVIFVNKEEKLIDSLIISE